MGQGSDEAQPCGAPEQFDCWSWDYRSSLQNRWKSGLTGAAAWWRLGGRNTKPATKGGLVSGKAGKCRVLSKHEISRKSESTQANFSPREVLPGTVRPRGSLEGLHDVAIGSERCCLS